MKDRLDESLDFASSRYEEGRFDTNRALRRFHGSDDLKSHRRWFTMVAAAAVSAVVVFAAGYGIMKTVNDMNSIDSEPVQTTVVDKGIVPAPAFVYEDVPVEDVLKELSEYFDCTLTTSPTRKHLTATFPDDDLDLIVSIIESVLEIEITVER